MDSPAAPPATVRFRIPAIDVARGVALAAMAIYHFAWDLEFFGYADPGMTAQGGWKFFARAIASSFLFLVGVSLFLGHGDGIRWPSFWRRFAMVAGAAAAITLATWFAIPQGFIFFGILHQIALASLLGLAFLRLPWPLLLVLAAAFVAAPHFLRAEAFDHPVWWWSGLSLAMPRSNDYVPVFPWFGAVLCGMAAARLAKASGALETLAGVPLPRWSGVLGLAGRHSLLVYLVHQPVLIAALFVFSQVAPPESETLQVQFRQSCEARCAQDRGEEFCAFYCMCVLDEIERENMLDAVFSERQDAATEAKVDEIATACVGSALERGG
jgi:uncharacterized membrane protein